MQPVSFRSSFNRLLSALSWGVLAVLLVLVLTSGGVATPLIPLGILAVAGAVWAVLWSPRVLVDDDGVTIVNILRRIRIPWAAVIHVDTRFALTVHTPGRTFAATAAPAPGQLAGLRASRSESRGAGGSERTKQNVRPGDLPTTDSGRAAALIRERWARLRDAGAIEAGVADQTRVEARVRLAPIAVLVAAAAIIALGIATPLR